MCPPTKVDGVWPFNDAWLRTSLEEARRQAPRNVASILDAARELGIRDAQVHFAFEATGHVWEAVGAFFEQHALRYHVVNPLATFRVREARQMGRDKRALTNAEQIAQRLRTGVVTQCQLLPANYMQLRRAWGEYHRLRRERARLKTLLVHQLYGVFPELVGEWHTVTAPGCLAVLRAGLPPQRIADLTKPDFIRVVQAHRRGRRMWRFKIEQVWEKAGRTVAAPHGHQAAMREVTRLVERIDCIGDQLDHVAAELQTFLGENAKPPNFPKDSGSILLLGCTARPLDEPSSVALRPSV